MRVLAALAMVFVGLAVFDMTEGEIITNKSEVHLH